MAAVAMAALITGCKPENKFQPPPPANINVGVPVKQDVAPFEVLTGNTVAFATVDLVARVEGFLTSQNYVDGSEMKKGQQLFGIEQTMYKAKVKEAEAQLDGAKASLVQAEAEFTRQETLLRQNVSAQTTFDTAKAKRDNARANVENAEGNLTIAQTNLGYTTVLAPFDGIVSKHLISVGELVGASTATKLATIVQLDPMYVTFNMSEQDVLQIRQNLKERRVERLRVSLRHDQRHGLPGKAHLVGGQKRLGREGEGLAGLHVRLGIGAKRLQPVDCGVGCGKDGEHARSRVGRARIDRADQRMCMRRAQNDGMGQPLELQVVEIGALAGDEACVLAPSW